MSHPTDNYFNEIAAASCAPVPEISLAPDDYVPIPLDNFPLHRSSWGRVADNFVCIFIWLLSIALPYLHFYPFK